MGEGACRPGCHRPLSVLAGRTHQASAAVASLAHVAAPPLPAWQVPKAPGGSAKKKKGKGQKLDGALLGFASGTNYSLLEQPE